MEATYFRLAEPCECGWWGPGHRHWPERNGAEKQVGPSAPPPAPAPARASAPAPAPEPDRTKSGLEAVSRAWESKLAKAPVTLRPTPDDDLAAYLQKFNLQAYQAKLQAERYDLDLLTKMTDKDLLEMHTCLQTKEGDKVRFRLFRDEAKMRST